MTEPICECFLDDSLNWHRFNCHIHDPELRLKAKVATLEAKLTRRDAVFAALHEYAKEEAVFWGFQWFEAIPRGDRLDKEDEYRRMLDALRREALKLAEGVE